MVFWDLASFSDYIKICYHWSNLSVFCPQFSPRYPVQHCWRRLCVHACGGRIQAHTVLYSFSFTCAFSTHVPQINIIVPLGKWFFFFCFFFFWKMFIFLNSLGGQKRNLEHCFLCLWQGHQYFKIICVIIFVLHDN